jgi:hypothetical protein
MPFLDCTFEKQGDPCPEFPAGPTHYLREGRQILLCAAARHAVVNSYTDSKKRRIFLYIAKRFKNLNRLHWFKLLYHFYFNTLYRASSVILYNDQQMYTIISQIITLLHVSTLSCLPQGAANQCF